MDTNSNNYAIVNESEIFKSLKSHYTSNERLYTLIQKVMNSDSFKNNKMMWYCKEM